MKNSFTIIAPFTYKVWYVIKDNSRIAKRTTMVELNSADAKKSIVCMNRCGGHPCRISSLMPSVLKKFKNACSKDLMESGLVPESEYTDWDEYFKECDLVLESMIPLKFWNEIDKLLTFKKMAGTYTLKVNGKKEKGVYDITLSHEDFYKFAEIVDIAHAGYKDLEWLEMCDEELYNRIYGKLVDKANEVFGECGSLSDIAFVGCPSSVHYYLKMLKTLDGIVDEEDDED